jgi:outer membrane receptor protein involved in Fe transport
MPRKTLARSDYLVLAAALAALAPMPAGAQQGGAAAAGKTNAPPGQPATAVPLEAVVIKNPADRDDRRESTATKIVVTRDELARFGDSTVADVLNRVPGVTAVGTPGRGAEIRMRGPGSGYTQILLNGEPVAPGFSLDSLSPGVIERIEVMRSATADQSAQAIAGTINIILKQTVRSGQKDFKASVSSERGHPSVNLTGQLSDRLDATSYTVAASVQTQKSSRPASILITGQDTQGQAISARTIDRDEFFDSYTLSLTPRLTWTASERDKVVADGFVSWQTFNNSIRDTRSVLFGVPPLYGDNDSLEHADIGVLRARLAWTRSLDDGANFELKAGTNHNQRNNEVHRRAVLPGQDFDTTPSLSLERFVDSTATDHGVTLNGKYRAPFAGTHAFVLGWDGERSRRSDDRIQRTPISQVEPPENLDQAYVAHVDRLAFFAQDEWQITKRWSTYLGLRWESLRTSSAGNTLDTVNNRSNVVSPILQSLWKIPETAGDQLRLGLSRTYRAPLTRDLIARRYRNYDNSPTSADFEGNPHLRPELAWGLDAAYERHLDDSSGLLSANIFLRQIEDVIQQRLRTDAEGRWVASPANMGKAKTYGIELEAKGNLRKLHKSAPLMDLRANLARNWSKLDTVPGSNNRLSSQIPLSANMGADWRPEGLPLTLGANLSLQHGGRVRLEQSRYARSSPRRLLDLYGLWKLDTDTQWRLTLSNLLHQNAVQENGYLHDGGQLTQTATYPTTVTVRLMLEMKL